MNVLFVARATLFKVYGGDSVQIISTAKYLRRLGVNVDIRLSNETIDYSAYDLLHIFNVGRPADLLVHIQKSGLPYVVSTIFIDFSEYQELNKGIRSTFSKYFSSDTLEYLKAIARWLKNGERIQSTRYLYLGHRRSVEKVITQAAALLPNSESEYRRLVRHYKIEKPYVVIYNGIDTEIFNDQVSDVIRDPRQVLCVARIEGNKNQLNLIKALNNTEFRLKLIGKPAPNHIAYYNECKRIAAANITFEDFMPHEQLIKEYAHAKLHVLPSWNETCGLSSLEAAHHRCNLVITNKGDTVEYFGNNAWYCNPADPGSIYDAIAAAAAAPPNKSFHEKISETYNWHRAAVDTYSVYKAILNGEELKKNDNGRRNKAAKLKVTF